MLKPGPVRKVAERRRGLCEEMSKPGPVRKDATKALAGRSETAFARGVVEVGLCAERRQNVGFVSIGLDNLNYGFEFSLLVVGPRGGLGGEFAAT